MHNPYDFEKASAENKLLDCSIGTANLLNSFAILAQQRHKLSWDTILINVHTLVRNNVDDITQNDKEVVLNVNRDIDMLLTYINEYNSLLPDLENPYVVLYIPTYTIPRLHQRKYTDKYRKIVKVTQMMGDSMNGDIEKAEYQNFMAYVIKVGKMNFPHIELNKKLLTFNRNVKKIMYRRYLLISHCPIDFHMHKYFKSFQLLESFTGKVKNPNQFGEKVFKYGTKTITTIPFNSTTHLLMGDKVHFTPVAKNTERKKIVEYSQTLRWNNKTEKMILDDIRTLKQLPIELLTTVKL